MPLNRKKIEKSLSHTPTVRVYDVIDSTNNEAKRRAEEDHGRCVLYAAERQSAGRGRRGHSFYSPSGGLYMTLSLPVGDRIGSIQQLTCAAAVAVCEAIKALSGLSPAVKWVNDIYVDGRKVAGILAELVLDGMNRPTSVIIGIGVNLTTAGFPAEIADIAGTLGAIDPERLCARIADLLMDYDEKPDYNSIIEKYRELNFCLGRTIRYTDTEGEHTATAVDVADDGTLIVCENGKTKSLRSGEISISF